MGNSSPNLISVIIPTYNGEQYIKRAIESVIDQSYKNTEILVIDDGSTDKTADLVKSYGDLVNYFYKDNGGVSSARNLGLKNAKGDYIAFLDTDDFWHKDKLQLQFQCLQTYPDNYLCHTKVTVISRNDKPILTKEINFESCEVRNFNDLFLHPYIATSSVMFKSTIFNLVESFDETLQTAEDIDLYLRATLNRKYCFVNLPLTFKYFNPLGLSESTQSYIDNLKVLDTFLESNKSFKNQNMRLIKSVYSKVLVNYGNYLLSIDRVSDARKIILRSAKYSIKTQAFKLYLKSFLTKSIREKLWSQA